MELSSPDSASGLPAMQASARDKHDISTFPQLLKYGTVDCECWRLRMRTADIVGSKVLAATETTRGTTRLATDGENAANSAVQADNSRLSDVRATTGDAGGDLRGQYPNPTITNNAVTSGKIKDGEVDTADLAGDAVTSAKIANGTIMDADISLDTKIASSKLSEDDPQVGANTPNRVPRWNGSALVSGTIVDNGNVGIGKTPLSFRKLDVNGNVGISGTAFVFGSFTAWQQFYANAMQTTTADGHPSYESQTLTLRAADNMTVLKPGRNGFRVVKNDNSDNNLSLNNSNGNLWIRGTYYPTSDSRTKANQEPLNYGLAEVLELRPMRFLRVDWSMDQETGEIEIDEATRERDFGLIAQDVYEIMPEAVKKPEDESTEYWGLAYDNLIAVLAKAIQEQQAQIDELKQDKQALAASVTLTDTPLTADFDGDGRTDRALVSASGDPSASSPQAGSGQVWYFWLSSSGFVKIGPYNFGMNGKPVASDFDGDGKADPGIVSASGEWYAWLSANGYSQSKL